MHLLLVLSSITVSLGKSPVYVVVTGAFKGNYDGLYEERRQPVIHPKSGEKMTETIFPPRKSTQI